MSSRAPKGLKPEQIVAAALAELDAVGLDVLSVRGVARRLGVQAPALYWHLRNKRELLDAAGTQLWRPAIDAAVSAARTSSGDAGVIVMAYARSLRTALLSCRDGARVVSSTHLRDQGLLESMEAPLRDWAAAGHDVNAFVTLIQTAQHATIGFCLSEQMREETDLGNRERELRESPHVAGIGETVLGPPDDRFEAMLSLLIR